MARRLKGKKLRRWKKTLSDFWKDCKEPNIPYPEKIYKGVKH
jgi:hypothetical protein